MGTVRVVLRKCRKLKDGRYPIVIRLTHNKKIKYIFTGHSALEREYNELRPHSSLKDLTPDEIYYELEKSPESLLETVAEIWE